MKLDLFINFDGKCREAVEFYAKVFQSEVKDLMTYGQTPPSEGYEVPEQDKDKIMYACVPIGGVNVMFCDNPAGMPLTLGNNLSPTVSVDDRAEAERIFRELSEGGEVGEELGKTFFAGLYGMVTDRYGVIWQVLGNECEM